MVYFHLISSILKSRTPGEPRESKLPENEESVNTPVVLQTTINYNADRTGSSQTTSIQSTHLTRASAFTAALTTLLDTEDKVQKSDFAEYDVKEDFVGEWPYGDECLVHAVGQTGENFLVGVKAQLKRKGGRK